MDRELFKDVISKETVLVLVPPSEYSEEHLYKAVYESVNNSELNNVVWVCYQHTPDIVEKKLDLYDLHFNSISFIDMISRMMGLKQDMNNIVYGSSPTDYNCLMRSLDDVLDKTGKGVVVVDNLNGMMSYDAQDRVIKILRSLNNRIPQRESTVLYLETTGGFDSHIEVTIQTTMNYVLKLDGADTSENSVKSNSWEYLVNTSWEDVFSLKSPLLFMLTITMLANIIFLSLLLWYVMMTR